MRSALYLTCYVRSKLHGFFECLPAFLPSLLLPAYLPALPCLMIKVAEQKEIKCHEIFFLSRLLLVGCWMVSYVKSFRCLSVLLQKSPYLGEE